MSNADYAAAPATHGFEEKQRFEVNEYEFQ